MPDQILDPLTRLVVNVEHLTEQQRVLQANAVPKAAFEALAAEVTLIRSDMGRQARDIKLSIEQVTDRFATAKEVSAIATVVNTKVSQSDFEPVKRLVYGLVALVLTGFVGALMTLLLGRGVGG